MYLRALAAMVKGRQRCDKEQAISVTQGTQIFGLLLLGMAVCIAVGPTTNKRVNLLQD